MDLAKFGLLDIFLLRLGFQFKLRLQVHFTTVA